ncbi:class I SAM-dependent methyltransferase [uncultured Pseudoteredinibacter sp.]|uniref:class I SAM-dependent methyltransferase n=1 Tax=uncultured Pseudoteredinibacter sp. TaxID=1641701 RepID=UPI00260EBF0C|nr:class I SAM-dependent methyltransferase [uncultured Pseudoteredinibacter sp.]
MLSNDTEKQFAQLLEHIEEKKQLGVFQSKDSRRIFHGRGQCYPGLEHIVIDYYSPVLWIVCFAEVEKSFLDLLCEQLKPLMVANDILALGVSYRYVHGAPSEWLYCADGFDAEETLFARRGELRFQIQLGGRQNSGFFLDMEPGRKWLEAHAKDKKVLNLFSYTCAFSVVAAAAGASEVVNVDMARGALKTGQKNHQFNHQLAEVANCKTRFLAENILKSWGRIRRPGPYGVLILDPPSFQKGSFVAKQDYAKLIRRIPQLAEHGADILLCLNAPELGEDFIDELIAQECPECIKVARLKPSEDFPDTNSDQQLKLFHCRYEGQWQQDMRA